MQIVQLILSFLYWLADSVSLELFVFFGSIIEEVIGPIPAPLIMTLAGTIAKTSSRTHLFLLCLAIVGSLGKLTASYLLYVLGDKGEDLVLKKYGKYLGISHEQIENIGKKFTGTWRDELALFALRAVPIFPTGLVSIACGVLRYNLRKFLVITFIGIILRNIFYLYIGFSGLTAYQFLIRDVTETQTKVIIITLIALTIIGAILYFKQRKTRNKYKEKNLS